MGEREESQSTLTCPILGPVCSRLDEEDANFYREVIEGEALHDNIEALSRSFRGVWNGAT